jgi:DNA-binding transcriptional ArsR family regulator
VAQHLLEGAIDNRDEIILALQSEKQDLMRENARLSTEIARIRTENMRAIRALRQQLEPLHRALKEVFGEIDAIGSDPGPQPSASPKNAAVWQAWKSRLGATASKVIDALLTHGELNTQQLAIATGLHRTTIPAGIYALNKAGLINKSGGRFSLKQI